MQILYFLLETLSARLKDKKAYKRFMEKVFTVIGRVVSVLIYSTVIVSLIVIIDYIYLRIKEKYRRPEQKRRTVTTVYTKRKEEKRGEIVLVKVNSSAIVPIKKEILKVENKNNNTEKVKVEAPGALNTTINSSKKRLKVKKNNTIYEYRPIELDDTLTSTELDEHVTLRYKKLDYYKKVVDQATKKANKHNKGLGTNEVINKLQRLQLLISKEERLLNKVEGHLKKSYTATEAWEAAQEVCDLLAVSKTIDKEFKKFQVARAGTSPISLRSSLENLLYGADSKCIALLESSEAKQELSKLNLIEGQPLDALTVKSILEIDLYNFPLTFGKMPLDTIQLLQYMFLKKVFYLEVLDIVQVRLKNLSDSEMQLRLSKIEDLKQKMSIK